MHLLGIKSPILTEKGAESWSAGALELIDHPCIVLIQEMKKYMALLQKYLEGSLRKSLINGRIHCTFSPNKRDEGGTITGRFSSSKPNLQNIPARDEKMGQEMRSLFVPDDGHLMLAIDYSQIEYILLANFAQGLQADWFREQACAGIDFHTVAMNMTGIESRDQVKRMNYGIIYGMGPNKMFSINRKTFKTLENTQAVFAQYHSRLPVIKDTMTYAQNTVKLQGYIESLSGRKHHKPRPSFNNGKINDNIYKITNYWIQGSAADIMKKAMIDSYKAGVYNELKLHLTVHDELVTSVPDTMAGIEAAVTLKECMCDVYKDKLKVPLNASCELGPSWGYWKDNIWKAKTAAFMIA